MKGDVYVSTDEVDSGDMYCTVQISDMTKDGDMYCTVQISDMTKDMDMYCTVQISDMTKGRDMYCTVQISDMTKDRDMYCTHLLHWVPVSSGIKFHKHAIHKVHEVGVKPWGPVGVSKV